MNMHEIEIRALTRRVNMLELALSRLIDVRIMSDGKSVKVWDRSTGQYVILRGDS